jgi:quinol monooxygenase YgiN
MIIVEGWVKLAPGEIDRLHEKALWMMEQTRAENGCLSYCFSRAMEEPDTLRIAERWESQGALDAHAASDHMAEFNAAMGGATILGASLKSYEAEEKAKLLGD